MEVRGDRKRRLVQTGRTGKDESPAGEERSARGKTETLAGEKTWGRLATETWHREQRSFWRNWSQGVVPGKDAKSRRTLKWTKSFRN